MISWEQRIERSQELAQTFTFASEVLAFYAEIAAFQKSVYDGLGPESAPPPSNLPPAFHLVWFPPLLSLVKKIGPALLSAAAADLEEQGPQSWEPLLAAYWDSPGAGCALTTMHVFFSRALLQPYAEFLAARAELSLPRYGGPLCPFCGRKPQAGVLRPEGQGAKRSLVCSLCSTEWDSRRILCLACGEDRFARLAAYTSAPFEYVRVEACDTCQTYIKTVDLTQNGLAVPVVDELATTPLDLWAQEKGYKKLEPNLLGM